MLTIAKLMMTFDDECAVHPVLSGYLACLQFVIAMHALLALPARSGDAEMSTSFRPGGTKRVTSGLILAIFVLCLLQRSSEAVNGEYSKEAIISIAVLT